MATCPLGHESADDEFCDVCGREMGGAPAAEPSPAPAAEATAPAPPPAGATCVVCNAALAGRFCEECGHDSMAAVPSAPAVPAVPQVRLPDAVDWTATVTADRAYYDSVMAVDGPDAAAITFPVFCPDRHFPLQGSQISIGRQSRSRGIQPDIDLIGPPEDPGISHLHAVLLSQPDGSWAVADLDSANGTVLNDGPNPLPPNTPHPLADGDRLYLGAWTLITVRRTPQ